jgi:hypothetical protein
MYVSAPGRTRLECLALGKKAPDIVSLQLPCLESGGVMSVQWFIGAEPVLHSKAV